MHKKLLCLPLLPLCMVCSVLSHASQIDKTLLKEFNQVLISIAEDSALNQISVLNDFVENHPTFDRAYIALAEKYLYFGKVAEGKEYFEKLAQRFDLRSNSYWMLAKIHLRENQPQRVYESYRKALAEASPSYHLIKDFLEFIQQYPEASSESGLLQNISASRENRLLRLAISNYIESNYRQSVETFTQVSGIALRDQLLLDILGDCYFRLSNYQNADSVWKIGLDLSSELGDFQYKATFLNNLGKSADYAGNSDLATSYFDSAYAIAKRIGAFQLSQLIAGNYATALRIQGKFGSALPLYQKAILIAQKLKLNNYLANWYFGVAQTSYNTGRYNAALAAYDSSKSNALKMPNQEKLLIRIEYCKGDIYKNMNQFALAKSVYENAYELAKTNSFPGLRDVAQRKLADLMLSAGKNEEAINVYQEFVQNTTDLQRKCYTNSQIAEAYINEKQYSQAKKYYEKALKFAQKAAYRQYIGWCITGLANVEVLMGNVPEAIRGYTDALDIANEIAESENNPALLIEVQRGFGDAYKKSGDIQNAIISYKASGRLVEKSREKLKVEQFRIGFFSSASEIYNKLVSCYYSLLQSQRKPAYYDSLFYYLEMARGRSIKDIKFRKESTAGQLQKDKAYVEYQQLCDRLRAKQRLLREYANNPYANINWDSLYSDLEITRYTLMDQRLRLIEKEPSSAPEQKKPAISLTNIMNKLKAEYAGLLLYNINEATSFVLAVDGRTVKVIPLHANPEKLQSTVADLVDPFHHISASVNPQITFRAGLAHDLYQQLIKPVEDSLDLPQRLVIVPDIALMGLPFEMLLVETPDKAEYTQSDEPDYASNFVLQRYSIVYAPTTALLLQQLKAYSGYPEILIFSNPFDSSPAIANASGTRQLNSRGRWQFDPLPFAEKEAQQIQQTYPASKVYKRGDATKTAFFEKAPEYDIIHVATHGIVDSTFDAFSGLVLAAGDSPNDDGFLMGYELADRKINCDLITLSACETGLGKKVAGEGVLGLPRLFLNGGAKTVLMTLWKVDDQFAARIMPEFYNNYLNEKFSKADALRQAKLNIINANQQNLNKYKHPFYWASFALYGVHDSNNFSSASISPITIFAFSIIIFCLLLAAGYYYRKKKPA